MLSGSGLVGSEDGGVDLDFKNAKKVVADVQAGSWSAAGRAGLQAGRVIKSSSANQVE